MMPLVLANIGEARIVRRIGGSPETKRHLEDLGFAIEKFKKYKTNMHVFIQKGSKE